MRKITRRRRENTNVLAAALKGVGGFSLAAAASWIVYSNLAIDHEVTLPDALPAERKTYVSQAAGRLSYYLNRRDDGRPLVLMHSINAAASAYEMRPLFLRYRTLRPVFALDLPGYGFSERSKRDYTPELFRDALIDFLSTQVGQPADVVSLSLSGEFAAQAALARPDLFSSLALISPTGFSRKKAEGSSQQARRDGMSGFVHAALTLPIWSRPLFDLIATRESIEYFLQKSFMGHVPPDLVTYAYATSHQPGAENAPLTFLSGKLFTPDIAAQVYNRLEVPTLVLYDRDAFTSFDTLPHTLARNQYWQAVRLVPTLGLPHFELPDDTGEVLDKFWK